MSQRTIRYSDFVDDIDIDAFEDAIGFEPEYTDDKGNDVGKCPDIWGMHKHGDSTGKFAIHRDKKVYNCFVCSGGSLLSLAMEYNDLDIEEATDWIYQFVSEIDHRSDEDFISDFVQRFQSSKPLRQILPYFNPKVLDRFDDTTDWFRERGISDEVSDSYSLRYKRDSDRRSPRSGKHLGNEDYVGPSAYFPHFFRGRLLGWQQRWLDTRRPGWVPKYTMTQDFPKKETVFNYDGVLSNDPGPVIVVESVPTVLFLVSHGHKAIATFGSSVTEEQMRLLRRFQKGVYISGDNDSAGRKFMDTLNEFLSDFVPVHNLPFVSDDSGSDLGDLARVESPGREIRSIIEARMIPHNLADLAHKV